MLADNISILQNLQWLTTETSVSDFYEKHLNTGNQPWWLEITLNDTVWLIVRPADLLCIFRKEMAAGSVSGGGVPRECVMVC